MARELDVLQQSYIRYESNRPFPTELLERLIQKFGVNPEWLCEGVGEMFLPPESEIPKGKSLPAMVTYLLKALKRMKVNADENIRRLGEVQVEFAKLKAAVERGNRVQQRAFDARSKTHRGRVEAAAEDVAAYGPDLVAVPILSGTVGAGNPGEVDERTVEDWAICYAPNVPHPKQTTAVRIRGESMEDLIGDGGLVGVDHSVKDIGIILRARLPLAVVRDPDTDGVIVREAEEINGSGVIVFRPRNRAGKFPTIVWHQHRGDPSPIVGKVVWIYRGV